MEYVRGMAGTIGLVAAALCAFAANSLLCRIALADGAIDPLWFTALRMLSGAVVLGAVLLLRGGSRAIVRDPIAALSLLVYAECFAWAYVELGTGAGALLLFGAVQVTMTAVGMIRGERLSPRASAGLVLAATGLVAFLLPVEAPQSARAAVAMLVAGCAWGVYSLRGSGRDPVAATAWNFILVAPLAVGVPVAVGVPFAGGGEGVAPAVASGAIASGLGYVLWYRAVAALSAVGAATAQLCVPLLAAFGGFAVLGEAVGLKLFVVSVIVLGGVALVNTGLRRAGPRHFALGRSMAPLRAAARLARIAPGRPAPVVERISTDRAPRSRRQP